MAISHVVQVLCQDPQMTSDWIDYAWSIVPVASIASWWSRKMPTWLRIIVQLAAFNFAHVVLGPPPVDTAPKHYSNCAFVIMLNLSRLRRLPETNEQLELAKLLYSSLVLSVRRDQVPAPKWEVLGERSHIFWTTAAQRIMDGGWRKR